MKTTLSHCAPEVLLLTRIAGIRATAEHYSQKLRTQICYKAIRSIRNAIKSGEITVTREQLENVAESDPILAAMAKAHPDFLNP